MPTSCHNPRSGTYPAHPIGDEAGLTDRYAYDSAYRVVSSTYDGEATGAAPALRELAAVSYRYDGVGNRVEEVASRRGSGPSLAIQGDERVDLGQRSVVEGDVVADGQDRCPRHGRRRCGCHHGRGRSDVDVGPEARVAGDVTGHDVTLRARARVDGDVAADRLFRHPTATVGGALAPFVSPEPIADIDPVHPTQQRVVVRGGQTVLLQPGAYGTVDVQRGGRLALAGGTYELAALEVGPQALVEVRGASVIRVARKLALGQRSSVVLAPGVAPRDVRWESEDRQSAIGPEAVFLGVLVAPDGDLHVGQGAQVEGQLQGERVRVGPEARVRGLSGAGTREVRIAYVKNSVNEYVSVGGVARDHDDNGNLTDDGQRTYAFDYKNRLVAALRKADGHPIALYGYLADGRRVRKQVWNPDTGALVKDVRFILDGGQEVEEQDWSSGATTTTYVWSPVYVDELVEFTNSGGSFFAHQDARCDVVAVTNASGAVVERRRFDDFGRVEVRDGSGAVVATSPSGLDYGFQGRRLDPETGLVFFRARYYSPETGRFVQRDPVWDAGNVGGQYTFCGNGPASGRDPGGLLDQTGGPFQLPAVAPGSTGSPAGPGAGGVGSSWGPYASETPFLLINLGLAVLMSTETGRDLENWVDKQVRSAASDLRDVAGTFADPDKESSDNVWRMVEHANRLRAQEMSENPKAAEEEVRRGLEWLAAQQPQQQPQQQQQPQPQPQPKPQPKPPQKPCPDKEQKPKEYVSLWKAGPSLGDQELAGETPQQKLERWLLYGFAPGDFPGRPRSFPDGNAYFAAPNSRSIADEFAQSYGQGVIEVRMEKEVYEKNFRQYEQPYQGGPRRETVVPQSQLQLFNRLSARVHHP